MFRPYVGHRRLICLHQSIRLVGATLILAWLLPTAAAATTPTDVLHAVDQIVAKVRLLHEANFSDATVKKRYRPQRLHPRHLLQMVRVVQQKANTLAWLNGAETIVVGPIPTRKVKQADVLANIDAVAWIIDGMIPIFGIKKQIEPTARHEGATSKDVYSTLLQLSQLIDGLGTPRIAPNNLYMIVDSIVFELEILANHYMETYELEEYYMAFYHEAWIDDQRPEGKIKSLKDIYPSTFALADALNRLVALRPELAPAGSILRPFFRPGVINADLVSYTLNDVLADIVAMKAATGNLTRTPSKRLASGITPTHVVNRLQDALSLVDALTTRG